MTFQIRLAGKIIRIHSVYGWIYRKSLKYQEGLLPDVKPDIEIHITRDEIKREMAKILHKQAHYFGGDSTLGFPDSIDMILAYKKIASEMLRYNTILMHGAIVSTNGNGYMITASPGIGKSTRALLWKDNIPGSIIVNGDKPLVTISKDAIYAHGTPWCGKEGWNTPITVPLKAILLLERSEKEADDRIEEISMKESMDFLIQQTYFGEHTDTMVKVMRLLMNIEGKVAFYRFRSSPTAQSICTAYNEIIENNSRLM